MGQVLRAHREANGLTQQELARHLHVEQSYISKIETGAREVRDVEFLRRIVKTLGIPAGQLGISRELQEVIAPEGQEAKWQAAVGVDQQRWLLARQYLNQHRSELARVATTLYPDTTHVGGRLITRPAWLPPVPVDLFSVEQRWVAERRAQAIRGTEPEAMRACPLRSPGHHFERYTLAVRGLCPPTLFENRPSYRLLDIGWPDNQLTFGLATYFDKLDVSEAVGHELADLALQRRSRSTRSAFKPAWPDLPFRSLIDDPFDLARRAVLPAITTLTLRRETASGRAAFLLHWREAEKVATAGGLYDVIPAGEFQPSTVAPWDQVNDFDVWKNIVREFSEELLGNPEHDGSSGTPIDYDAWPLYRELNRARDAGSLRAFCFGVGLDALTLAATILTAVIVDDDAFDEIFRDIVGTNAEGRLALIGLHQDRAAEGLDLTESTVTELLNKHPMASPGAACLALAWQYRALLLEA